MLDLIRKKKKSAIVKLVFWAIIATFVGTIFLVWGKGDDGRDETPTIAISVNGTDISYTEYQNAYNDLYQLYQNIYREQFTPALEKQLGIRKQVVDSLIDETLLLQEAKKLKIDVSQKELIDSIATIPAFQDNGVFSKNRYLQVLAYQRLSPEDFEALQKQQLLIAKAQAKIQEGVSVSNEDIEQEYRDQNEKVNLVFAKSPPALFEHKVEIRVEDLESFFADNREEFRIPESVALQYLQFDPSRYADQVIFSDEDLEKYYRRHLDLFEINEQAKISHILIKAAAGTSTESLEKKRLLAQKIVEEIRAGKDFATLARKHSDDARTAANGGAMGYVTRDQLNREVAEAAFALKPGDLSEVVQTSEGFHIIRSEGYIEAGIKPFADVLDEIKTGLRVEKSQQMAMEAAMDAYNINRKSGDLSAAAAANNLVLQETGFFSRQEAIEGLGTVPEISAVAFALEEKELGRPVVLPGKVILYGVKERRPSRLPELSEVQRQVEMAFRQEKSRELALEAARKVLKGIESGKSLSSQAAQQGLPVEETGFFTRSYGSFVPRIGDLAELSQAAFSLSKENPAAPEVYTFNGQYLVAALKNRQEADMEALTPAIRDTLSGTLLARKQEQKLAETLKNLREQSKITIAPTILSALKD
ncbi:peptidylprolyl isomerase [Desulfuromonas sp. AOP6]|uniref:peptidylprolyl isomerase n=1 Tax=Desulfuromonas sp. AOP6 TaxID=1566351 RepID=UPI001281AF1E|nr:peptidylprolyl isomerase [Desulfuromonas sp. AOP6]BCA80297.1 hypothetical protein AOP6_2084 [Desulfuromonas sp. AOP6]